MKLKDGIYYMNAEEARKVRHLISRGYVVMPDATHHRWTCESDGGGLRFPCTGDRSPVGPSDFRDQMARYGITVQVAKADGGEAAEERLCRTCLYHLVPTYEPPCLSCRTAGMVDRPNWEPRGSAAKADSRIDKHAVADAIQRELGRCLDGSRVEGGYCDVCKAMGRTQGDPSRCAMCPVSKQWMAYGTGCGSVAEACKDGDTDMITRVVAIVKDWRSTTGDDRWIEIKGKKRTVKREDLAVLLERVMVEALTDPHSECNSMGLGGHLCKVCPIRGTVCGVRSMKADGSGRYGLEIVRYRYPRWSELVGTIATAITSLRSQGGEIEL